MDNIREEITEYKKGRKKVKKIEFIFTDGLYDKRIGVLYITAKERIYHKKVDSTKHKLRIFDGYGIQKEVFDKYLKGKNGKIVIDETDTLARLRSNIEDWENHGIYQNRGEGKQIFLGTNYMKKITVLI